MGSLCVQVRPQTRYNPDTAPLLKQDTGIEGGDSKGGRTSLDTPPEGLSEIGKSDDKLT